MHTASVDIEFDPEQLAAIRQSMASALLMPSRLCVTSSRVTIQDPDHHDEQRFLTLGMDTIGRILVVCHMQRGELTRLISARKASPNETRNYHG
jgi:uncharacterized DUF497 family protein